MPLPQEAFGPLKGAFTGSSQGHCFPYSGKGGFPGGQVPTSTVSHTKGFPAPGQEAGAFPQLPFPAYFKPPKDATGGKDLKTKGLSMLGVVL